MRKFESKAVQITNQIVEDTTNLDFIPTDLPWLKYSSIIEEIGSDQEKYIIGGKDTYLCMKDESSYLLATSGCGLKLIEDKEVLYTGILPKDAKKIQAIFFAENLNCYFFMTAELIFRKDINSGAPYLYYEIPFSAYFYPNFRYSQKHDFLAFAKSSEMISILNLKDKEEEEMSLSIGKKNFLSRFEFFGEKEDSFITLENRNQLVLYSFDYDTNQRAVLGVHVIENEKARNLAVSSDFQYCLVQTVNDSTKTVSKMLVYSIITGKFFSQG